MYPDPSSVTRITSIGAGPIGGGWSAHFLARGYDVTAYLHDAAETEAFHAILNTAWKSLTGLGLAPGASLDRLLQSFVDQFRMKLPGTAYEPCYRVVT